MEFGKIFSGWQIILLRHTGDFQKSVLLEEEKDKLKDAVPKIDCLPQLPGHKVHPRNALCDHHIAELLMFVGRPLRAEARQSCYESQFRTTH